MLLLPRLAPASRGDSASQSLAAAQGRFPTRAVRATQSRPTRGFAMCRGHCCSCSVRKRPWQAQALTTGDNFRLRKRTLYCFVRIRLTDRILQVRDLFLLDVSLFSVVARVSELLTPNCTLCSSTTPPDATLHRQSVFRYRHYYATYTSCRLSSTSKLAMNVAVEKCS